MKKILLISLLITPFLVGMEDTLKRKRDEKEDQQQMVCKKILLDQIPTVYLGLPVELWHSIFEHVYFDSTILDEVPHLFEGIATIQQYVPTACKTVSLVCKTFRALNIPPDQWSKFKEKIKAFYITHLNQRFLEKREGQEGLYPKNSKWHTSSLTDESTAKFISTRIMSNNSLILQYLIREIKRNPTYLKFINMLLFYGADPNIADCTGITPLLSALAIQDSPKQDIKNLVSLLLKYGANFNTQDNCGFTALHLAAHPKQIHIMRLLLKHGGNLDIKNEYGDTPLYIAIAFHTNIAKNKDIIVLLLTHGANPNIQNAYGKTALYCALAPDKTDLIQLLLEHGANPNIQDFNGRTPLHWAVVIHNNIHPYIIILFLLFGADSNIKDNMGKTAFDIARESNFYDFEQLVAFAQDTLKGIDQISTNSSLF